MKPIEIDAWALRVLDRVQRQHPIEDTRVEVKSVWPDAKKTARQLAGHANAARGEPILWLIGVNEKIGIKGASYQELSKWLAQIKAEFDGEAPALQDLNIHYKTHTITALCFDTLRFPYVVKNPDGGKIQLEVPWREGTSTRTANRNDLVLMLLPLIRLPKVELVSGDITYNTSPHQKGGPLFTFSVKAYIIPIDNTLLTFPFHKCSADLTANGNPVTEFFKITLDTDLAKWRRNNIVINTPRAQHLRIHTIPDAAEPTADEITIRAPAKIEIQGQSPTVSFVPQPELHLTITLVDAITEAKQTLSYKFINPVDNNHGKIWHFIK